MKSSLRKHGLKLGVNQNDKTAHWFLWNTDSTAPSPRLTEKMETDTGLSLTPELEITTSSSPLIACPLWVETYHDLISPPEEVKIISENLETRHTVLGYSGLALMVLSLLCVCGMLIFAVTEYPKADLLKMPPKERSHQ